MRITGLMVCGPNEKYLERSLKEFQRLCDSAIIATNNADPETIKLIEKYAFTHYEDNREWGIEQPNIKTTLLDRIGELQPDWILALDADEVFAPEFTRAEAEKLAQTKEIAFHFLIVNLYNDEKHFAHSSGIQRFWNIRFFKYLPEYGNQYLRKNLHCGLAPPVYYKYGWHAPFYVLHYGLMSPEDRKKKWERYRKYDAGKKFKTGNYYEELLQELPMRKFEPKKLLEQLKEAVDTQPREQPPIPKCAY